MQAIIDRPRQTDERLDSQSQLDFYDGGIFLLNKREEEKNNKILN